MKKILAILVSSAVLVSLSCASSGGGKSSGGSSAGIPVIGDWTTQTDANDGGDSTITLTVEDEVIDGKSVKTYTITGKLTSTYQNSYLNLILEPTDENLAVLKQAKSFSFKCISDGNRYTFYFMTSDVKDWAFHAYNIDAEENVIETIEFPTGYLFQPGWGAEVPLRTQNCTGIRFAPHDSLRGMDEFKFKFWDLQVITK